MSTATIQTADMAMALKVVGKAVSANPVLTLLSNVLLDNNSGTARLTATNLEMGISCIIPSEGKKFKTCVPAKTLNSLVEALKKEEIKLTLNTNDQSLQVKAEGSTAHIKCIPPEDFPVFPFVDKPHVILPVQDFKEMVGRVAFAHRIGDEQSPLSGVLLILEEGKFAMFAVDGFHMSFEESTTAKIKKKASNTIIKATVLELISRTLPPEGKLYIQFNEKNVLFKCNEIDMVAQVMAGKFPDYKMFQNMLQKAKTTVTISTLEMLQLCKQLRIFTAAGGAALFAIEGMFVNGSSISQSKGDAKVSIPILKKGRDTSIAMNVNYLYQFLEVCKTEQFVLELAEASSPMVFRMKDFDNYYHVIMPVTT